MFFHRIEDGDARNLRRAEGFGHILDRIIRILNNVDLFSSQFTDDRLHAHAFHAHTGPHTIHIAIPAGAVVFGPSTPSPPEGFVGARAVINPGHPLSKSRITNSGAARETITPG